MSYVRHAANEEITDIAIFRLEQLYPFPEVDLGQELAEYENLSEVFWCQEEPMNQGAWYASQHHMRRVIFELKPNIYVHYIGREASAAAAAGYPALHIRQQKNVD